jgi:hypothetical protein
MTQAIIVACSTKTSIAAAVIVSGVTIISFATGGKYHYACNYNKSYCRAAQKFNKITFHFKIPYMCRAQLLSYFIS